MNDAGATDVSRPGADFYYASLYYPPRQRDELRALEALRRTLTTIPSDCSDRGVAHLKLAWWREELERAGLDQARHPLSRALVPVLAAEPALSATLRNLIDVVVDSLVGKTLRTEAEVDAALTSMHAGVTAAYIKRGGGGSSDDDRAIMALALDIERAAVIYGLREHRRDGTLLVAETTLAALGLNADAVRHAHASSPIQTFLTAQCATLRDGLDAHLATLAAPLRRRQRLFATLARIAVRNLSLTLEDGCRILERRVEVTPVVKLWLAWRTRWFG
ncbi:MAG: squalene/phytoene synthase family protein [Gammaproteobacteria bacterium]